MSEERLQSEVVKYIRLQYPKVRFCASLGGIYTGPRQATKAKRTGYSRGFPDLQICEARNIPYISYNFKSNLWRSLERIPRHLAPNKKDIPVATLLADLNMLVGALKSPTIFGVTDDISFASICEKEHLAFSEYSLGHPGIEAHKRMAEIIKEVMEKNGIFS
jgi:hypothetical protein